MLRNVSPFAPCCPKIDGHAFQLADPRLWDSVGKKQIRCEGGGRVIPPSTVIARGLWLARATDRLKNIRLEYPHAGERAACVTDTLTFVLNWENSGGTGRSQS